MKIIDINGMEREVKSVAPDPTYPGYVKVEFKRHHEWFTIQEFLEKNPTMEDVVKGAPKPPDDVVGVVSTATKNTLKDTSQKWKQNVYTGMWVWISRGKGEGQKRTVINNTHNALTIDQEWEVIPNKTSQYVVSYNIQEVKAMGNTLPQEDMKALERRAIQIDKARGRLTSESLKKNLKYLKPEEI